ncbi:hypothetical protein A8B78_09135 [Jannaschia sp. EhC01]|nr:hypothetical protein A8B78_09135 [Jannaschia sp. EhC01]
MIFKRSITALASLASLVAAPAFATGIVPAPPQEGVVVVTPPATDWEGFYGGFTLGYGTGTYGNDTSFPIDGEGELNGMTYGIAGGYYFQNGNWVYGPELAVTGTHLSGSESCANPAFTCEVDFNYMAALRANVGYLVSPDTLLFGTVGIVGANVDVFTDNGTVFGDDHWVTGYQLGIGAEYALSDTMRLRGTVSHYMFNDGDYQTDVLYNGIGMDATVVEVGVMFRF